jgi:hypothetical protein
MSSDMQMKSVTPPSDGAGATDDAMKTGRTSEIIFSLSLEEKR